MGTCRAAAALRACVPRGRSTPPWRLQSHRGGGVDGGWPQGGCVQSESRAGPYHRRSSSATFITPQRKSSGSAQSIETKANRAATTGPKSTQLTQIDRHTSQPETQSAGWSVRGQGRSELFGIRMAQTRGKPASQMMTTQIQPTLVQSSQTNQSHIRIQPSLVSNRFRHQCRSCCWRRRPLDAGNAALRAAWRAAPALHRAERVSVEASWIDRITPCSID